MMENWKVLIACASEKDIHPEYYEEDPLFVPSKKYVFFNVGKERFSHPRFEVINAIDIPGYNSLGRKYAESEIIYNVRKLNLFPECDYIGLMHYDFNFLDNVSFQTNITALIDSTIKSGVDFISFFGGSIVNIIGRYNVLFDKRKPNCLFVRDSGLKDPRSINDKIVVDIKRVLGIDFNDKVKDMDLAKSKIALCCSFLAKRDIFNQAGDLIVDLIDSHCLDGFDTEDRHRFPGQVAERYIAFFSLLFKKACFKLDHKFIGGNADINRAWNAENY